MLEGRKYALKLTWAEVLALGVTEQEILAYVPSGSNSSSNWGSRYKAGKKNIPDYVVAHILYTKVRNQVEGGIDDIEDVRLLSMVRDLREIMATGNDEYIAKVSDMLSVSLQVYRTANVRPIHAAKRVPPRAAG